MADRLYFLEICGRERLRRYQSIIRCRKRQLSLGRRISERRREQSKKKIAILIILLAQYVVHLSLLSSIRTEWILPRFASNTKKVASFNCVLFLYDFFSKIVSTQHDTITTDLFHYTLSLDALYCSFFYLLRYNSCDSTPTFF